MMLTDGGITTFGANRSDSNFARVFHVGTIRGTNTPPFLGAIDTNGLLPRAYA
jgi:hypothetical protein